MENEIKTKNEAVSALAADDKANLSASQWQSVLAHLRNKCVKNEGGFNAWAKKYLNIKGVK